ncbi:MAG: hypothetical protein ACOY7L_17140 [Pseudomonadota bacterium]
MTDWVRLWHDMPTDPKWRAIARRSGQPLPCVIALFNLLMVNASANAENRGTLFNWDSEDAAAALDMETEHVEAIIDAMQGKVLDGDRLTGWEKRQPKREDSGVAARVAKHRETQREKAKRTVTHGNAPETETDTDNTPLTPQGEKEAVSISDPAKPDPVAELVQTWNEVAEIHDLPTVKKITDTRRRQAKARIAEYGLAEMQECVGRLALSPFLSGKTPENFKADFDFLLASSKLTRLREGFYDPRDRRPEHPPPRPSADTNRLIGQLAQGFRA